MVFVDVFVVVLFEVGVNVFLVFVLSFKEVEFVVVLEVFFFVVQLDIVLNGIVFVVFKIGVVYQLILFDKWGKLVLQVVFFLLLCEGWQESDQGLLICDFVMYVVLLEIDGCLLMWVVFFKEEGVFDEVIQLMLVWFMLVLDWIDFVVQFVVNWVWLGYVLVKIKKIVLIFVNYLNKDGWLINGVGLDIFVFCVVVLKGMVV